MRTIHDILQSNRRTLWTTTPDAMVKQAMVQMAEKEIEALPVVEAGRLVGVISKVDCFVHLLADEKSEDGTRVQEIMARDYVYTTPYKTVEECLDLMNAEHIQHLPVVANDRLVGIVSMGDVMRKFIEDQEDTIHHLENYIMGVGYAQ